LSWKIWFVQNIKLTEIETSTPKKIKNKPKKVKSEEKGAENKENKSSMMRN